MAHVFDVARYILERTGPVTTLKLQKLVYYVQAWAIAKGEPLFNDTIKAWAQGPVVPVLWHEHKNQRQVEAADVKARGRGLTAQDREHIDSVLAHYGNLPPRYLSELTHFEHPWKDARSDGEQSDQDSPAITVAALRSFYSGRTPEELEVEYQMAVARQIMDKHADCFKRLAQ